MGDAIARLGDRHPYVVQYRDICAGMGNTPDSQDLIAYLQLRIITAALNDGWTPKHGGREACYYPQFWGYDEAALRETASLRGHYRANNPTMPLDGYKTELAAIGSAYAMYTPYPAVAAMSAALGYRYSGLAEYSGMQFLGIWADYMLTKK